MNLHDRRRNDADLSSIARMLAGLDRENDMQAEAIDEARRQTEQAQATVAGLSVELVNVTAERDDLRLRDLAAKIVGKGLIRELSKVLGEVDDAKREAERAATLVSLIEASRDEAREQRDDCAATLDKLRAELHEERAEAERVVADLKTRLAGSDAEAVRLHEENDQLRQDGAELFAAVVRAFIGADSKTMKRRRIADILGAFIPADSGPILKPWSDAAPVAELADWTATAPGHTDLMVSPEAIEAVEAPLPAGFVEVDLATLPDDLAARIRADAPKGAAFVEIDAADLPESVFRRIYALPPEGTAPVMVAEQAAAPEVEGVE